MSLAGKRIVNTRATHQAAELDMLLLDHDAIPLDYPCIAIVPPEDTTDLDHALLARAFDLLILTSVNTVISLAERLAALHLSLTGVSTAAVGETTAQTACDLLGVAIRLLPDEFSADGLAHALTITPGLRVCLPQSEIARPDLAETLRSRGADVTTITAYRTVCGSGGVDLPALLRNRQVDAITLTSSSTARFLVERLQDAGVSNCDGMIFASIGAQTTRTARDCGLTVAVEAQPHTLNGLVAGLAAYFQDHP